MKTNSSPWCSSAYIYLPLSLHQLFKVLPHGSSLTLQLAHSSPFTVTGPRLLLSLPIFPAIFMSLLSYFHKNDWSTVPLMSLLLSCFKFPISRNTSHPLARGYLSVTQHVLENILYVLFQFSSVQSLSHVRLFATPWIPARQASLSITNSRSSLRLTSIESVMPSSHLILCRPLSLLPPIPPSIRVFSNEPTLRMRWPKYWSFSFSIIPSKEMPKHRSLS